MRLVHHTESRLDMVLSVPQAPVGHVHSYARWGKPDGLWVATDSGWAEYCASINRPLGAYHYEIRLARGANILRIGTAAEIDQFTETFGGGNPLEGLLAEPVPESVMEVMEHAVCDWHAVAKLYQGIIIHPHIRSRHLHRPSFWYYSWDVASGCIWDAEAIDSFELLRGP